MENYIETNDNELAMIERYNVMLNISEIIFHDFKNILATISGLAQLSMLNTQSEEVIQNLNNITKATYDLGDALNRYYLLTHGLNKESYSICKLHSIISDAINLLYFKFEILNSLNQKVNLVFNINSNAKIYCNEYEMKQCFLNLIMNSLEAMEETRGTLHIDIYSDEDNVYVDIIDSGTGISKENMDRLFNSTFTTKEKGTGLGLKIARNSIMKFGGMLDISSELGIGTMINISLPIYKEVLSQ